MIEMTLSVTKEQLIEWRACDLDKRLKLFSREKSMTAAQALKAGASVSDLLWVAGKLGLKRECVQFALACAQKVSHLNSDPRVRAALDATQSWLDNPSADAASYAEAAADAAYAAAYAAYAAYDADAAAYAAYAAARAAGAAYDAAIDFCSLADKAVETIMGVQK
jgi:hypothetical protein